MTRQVRNVIVATCVVAALVVCVVLLNVLPGSKSASSSSSASSTSSSKTYTLLSYKIAAFKSLAVTNSTGTYHITLSGGTYTVDALKEAPSNQSTITSNMKSVVGLTASGLIQKNVTDLAQYGLASPSATLVLTTTNGKDTTIKIGNKAPSGNGVYVLKPGTSDVYVSSTMESIDFTQSALVYASDTITSMSTSANLTSYKFGGTSRATPFTVAVKASTSSSSSSSTTSSSSSTTYTYTLQSPISYETNSTNLGTITTDLQSFSATKVVSVDVSDASLQQYGLLKPAYTLTYTVDGQDTTVSFGNVDTANSLVYATVTGKKAIYAVSTSSADFYDYELGDVLSTTVFDVSVDKVKTLTIQNGSDSYTFNVTDKNSTLKVTDASGKSISSSNFQTFFSDLVSLTTSGSGSKPANTSAQTTFTFTFNDGSASQTISFYPLDSDKLFIENNGNGGLYVYSSQVTNLLNYVKELEAGKSLS